MSRSRASMLRLAAAAPAVIGTLAVLVFAAREVSGTTPLSYGPVRNVAEAAGAGQVSEVLRFLRAGEDPAQFWPVRPQIISSSVTRPTGLEAALWGGRQLVELLDGRGLIRDASTRTHLFCLAKDIGSEEVASYLSPREALPCEAGAAFAAINDRSQRAASVPAAP